MIKLKTQKSIAAAILAGGRAARYNGAVKGELKLPDGRTIMRRLIEELRYAGISEIAIAANDPAQCAKYGCPVIADRHRNCGPLGGIEACLAYYQDQAAAVLFLPCDMPGITAQEIKKMKSHFENSEDKIVVAQTAAPANGASEGDFFWHPLCAIVHIDLHQQIEHAIVEGERSVWDLWRKLNARPVEFTDAQPFFNINAPQDLMQWLRESQRNPAGREQDGNE